jgi:CHASE2 domain-containing sensor protein
MVENKNTLLLKVVLVIFAIVALLYGLCYFFIPDFLVKLSGGEPVFHGWLRWSGGVLIALGIGSILVLRRPEKQDPFVITIALGSLLTGLALIYAWITAIEGTAIWFTAVPAILTLVLSALLWWSRYQSREILCTKKEEE